MAKTNAKGSIMKKNIAIIGSGISGLTSAYLLNQKHQITLFEVNDYIGGHTATVDVEVNGKAYSIDTGFIVFNDKTYPKFLELLDQIDIGRKETEMSFSVHNQLTGLEYNGHNLDTLFSQRKNIFNPKFWSLIRQIIRFNKQCKALYDDSSIPEKLSLGDFLQKNNFSDYFAQHYILPMGAAIWSTSLEQMLDFDLSFFIRFFYNHGLLNISDRPQWFVIPGGSRNYIPNLIAHFADRIKLNSKVKTVERNGQGVEVIMESGETFHFDDIVFACHSDQALKLLSKPTTDEIDVLGNIPYSANEVVLHTDINLLPKQKKSWASWNYSLDADRQRPAAVTYNMNILMGLESETTFCVTLNQSEQIDPSKVLRTFVYHHPVFNQQSFNAQKKRHLICGKNNTHFTGAYWHNGFHEDGVRSAVEIAERFGVTL